MQDHHQLDIWNRAMDYAVAIYKFSAGLPAEEKYNLTSQLRRAATSVEGCGAAGNAEFCRFLNYAYRSLKEVVTVLELCQRLYPSLDHDRIPALIDEGTQISKMIYTLMRKLTPGPQSAK